MAVARASVTDIDLKLMKASPSARPGSLATYVVADMTVP